MLNNNLKTYRYQDIISGASSVSHPSLRGHLQIARIDHWFKNVFIFPGIVAGISMGSAIITPSLLIHIVIGLASICLVASSNYVINEIMDAPFDRHHPTKYKRPIPSGEVNIKLAYAQWIGLMIVGVGLGLTISIPFTLTLLVLWLMGCIYNIPPVRSKDLPYVDVLSEAVNNPLRLLAGWFIIDTATVAPASLALSYWMVGCYFMAIKRYAEYRNIGNPVQAAAYRKSFAFYTEQRLLVSIMFYSSAAMLFLGAFIMRYRLELIASFPLVALILAIYLSLAFKDGSPVQQPERLYREPVLMVAIIACTVLMSILLFIDIPILHWIFIPTASTSGGTGALFYPGTP